MPELASSGRKTGAALVAGGGICGMQAALDLATSGIRVYLVDKKPAIGGVMSQLDKTFPTNDCAMCTMAPRLVEIGRNKDIDVITLSEIEKIEGEAGNFTVTLRRKARYIDVDLCLGCGACAEVCPVRILDAHNLGISETSAVYRSYPQAVPSSFAIRKMGQAPCRCACPIGQKVQGYIALIRERRFEDAFQVILRDNPFPSVCGRVCHRYCEEECARSRLDEAVSIRALKRFVADWAYERRLGRRAPPVEVGQAENASKRIAIVGAGPAGLTAARDLSDLGYFVSVLESLPRPGGMMWAGIPSFRLPRERLEWDLHNLLSPDIELRTNCRVESVNSLFGDGFDAVVLAVGMHSGKKLPVPGHDLPGVMVCTEFLRGAAMGEDLPVKEKVLVLGGGDVAMDVARTALRLGAVEVGIACLESRENMLADPQEVEAAEREGVSIFASRSFLGITSRNGDISGVKCVEVDFRGFDEEGRPDMDVLPGTEHVLEAETVIFAIGQAAEVPFADEGFELTRAGTIAVDKDTLATSKPGVFAAGDVVTGTRFIVDAVAAGHRAARSVDLYLSGEEIAARKEPLSKVELTDEEITEKVRSWNSRQVAGTLPAKETAEGPASGDRGYTEEMALAEAERCLQCGICSECLLCLEVCEAGAINHLMPREEPLELDVGAVVLAPGCSLFDARLKEDLGYGRYPNVLMSLEFERILSASGPSSGEVLRPSDGKPPKRIAFIQCVGSRDSERDYCSSVCCMYATKQAVLAKEHLGEEVECDIFFMDLRAFSKQFDQYYERAKKEGVNYIRCRPPSVLEIPDSKNLLIDYLVEDDRKVTREYDLVVLSVGLVPPLGVSEIAEKTGITLNDFNFCRTSVFAPVESNLDGIYVAGAFTEPKDIPETVMQGAAAASRVLSDLRNEKFSLVAQKEYPPEKDVAEQEPRIGVFVCHCGSNIASVVDVRSVVEYAQTLPEVVHAESNLYTCSNDTQELMKERVTEHGLNRVVVASCSPRTHEALFQDTIREGGLNPYLFEMANIRDQCSWVHRDFPEAATEKAKDLVRIAVAKARLDEPLEKRSVAVTKSALVIGGGAAGMTCANELADQGFPVFLVEKARELGGHLRQVRYLIDGEDPQEGLRDLIARTRENEGIQLFTETTVESVEGSVGNFTSTISSNGTSKELAHGVIIVATGAQAYRPNEYLYGEDNRVITQLELEEQLTSDGDWLGKNGNETPRSVVMIQCVGSRDEERPYCSRICCTEAIKNALEIKRRSPETSVCVLYRDIRVYGFKERFYSQARKEGVTFIQFDELSTPVVSRNEGGLVVEVIDQTLGMPIRISTDLVVLSTGVVPAPESEKTAKLLKVPLDSHGFFLEAHLKLRPVDFATAGIFFCGLAHWAKAVEESISQAQAAAARASSILSKDTLELEATISQVLDENCDGCAYCVDPCPANAITLIEYMRNGAIKKIVEVDETACLGCGCCQATCPKEGIRVRGFTLEQLNAQLDAVLGVT